MHTFRSVIAEVLTNHKQELLPSYLCFPNISVLFEIQTQVLNLIPCQGWVSRCLPVVIILKYTKNVFDSDYLEDSNYFVILCKNV